MGGPGLALHGIWRWDMLLDVLVRFDYTLSHSEARCTFTVAHLVDNLPRRFAISSITLLVFKLKTVSVWMNAEKALRIFGFLPDFQVTCNPEPGSGDQKPNKIRKVQHF